MRRASTRRISLSFTRFYGTGSIIIGSVCELRDVAALVVVELRSSSGVAIEQRSALRALLPQVGALGYHERKPT